MIYLTTMYLYVMYFYPRKIFNYKPFKPYYYEKTVFYHCEYR